MTSLHRILFYSFSVCRFKSSSSGLLLATDVAARGLDIPAVEHVIHYQVPKDPDVSSTPTTRAGLGIPVTTLKGYVQKFFIFVKSIVNETATVANHKGHRQSSEAVKTRNRHS